MLQCVMTKLLKMVTYKIIYTCNNNEQRRIYVESEMGGGNVEAILICKKSQKLKLKNKNIICQVF